MSTDKEETYLDKVKDKRTSAQQQRALNVQEDILKTLKEILTVLKASSK